MTSIEKPVDLSGTNDFPVPREGTLGPVLHRIDLVAILAALLGITVLGVAAVVIALIELAKLISSLWSDSFDRWLLMIFGVAVIWIIARRKHM
jgi:choline-glycine betaine transporter